MKLLDVYGILMSEEENMRFSKHVVNNNIAMNTYPLDERKAIALDWLERHKSEINAEPVEDK